MILRRYFMREILRNWLIISSVLVLIILMNQFIYLLSYISSGIITVTAALQLIVMQVPELAVYLLPLGVYLATFLTIGRWCADSELVVCYSCGVSIGQFYRYVLFVSVLAALAIAALVLFMVPAAHKLRLELKAQARASLTVSKVVAHRFQPLDAKGSVIYANSRQGSDLLSDVFVAQNSGAGQGAPGDWSIIRAHSVVQKTSANHSYVEFDNGIRALGTPGYAAYQHNVYDKYALSLAPAAVSVGADIDLLPTTQLIKIIHSSLAAMAEFQWRCSMPLATIIMALLAVPLAQVNPRRGKFGKFLPAIIIYVIYANLLFATRSWVASGKLNPAIGMWSVHLLFFALALVLISKHMGWLRGIFK